jgi:hypothetical protein
MKTYTPVKGMTECVNGSGTYVTVTDFEEESAQKAMLQNRLSTLQLDYQTVSARLKSEKEDSKTLMDIAGKLGACHVEYKRTIALYRNLTVILCLFSISAVISILLFTIRH